MNSYQNPFQELIEKIVSEAMSHRQAAITIIENDITVNVAIFQYPSSNFLVVLNDPSGYSYANPTFYSALEDTFIRLAPVARSDIIDLQFTQHNSDANLYNFNNLIREMPNLEGLDRNSIISRLNFVNDLPETRDFILYTSENSTYQNYRQPIGLDSLYLDYMGLQACKEV